MARHLFFDLDGTLTDPRQGIVRCLRYALSAFAVAIPTDTELEAFIGPPLQRTFASLLGDDDDLIAEALRRYRERFASAGMFENQVYPGIPELLESSRHAGWTLHVVTSKPTVFAAQILAHFDLIRHFAAVHGSELSGLRADKTELVAHVLATEQISAPDAVMIGDRSHDVVGAQANGVRALGVLWGYGSREELRAAGAARSYETVEALREALTAALRQAH